MMSFTLHFTHPFIHSFALISFSNVLLTSHHSTMNLSTLQNDEGSSQIRIRVIAGKSLAKKDIFGASDPYVRLDLNTINGDVNIDSVLTKTKKKVSEMPLTLWIDHWPIKKFTFLDTQPPVEWRVHLSCQAHRAQARVPSVRRESLYTRWLSRHGGADTHQFAKGTGWTRDSAQKLSASTAQVSWVR